MRGAMVGLALAVALAGCGRCGAADDDDVLGDDDLPAVARGRVRPPAPPPTLRTDFPDQPPGLTISTTTPTSAPAVSNWPPGVDPQLGRGFFDPPRDEPKTPVQLPVGPSGPGAPQR